MEGFPFVGTYDSAGAGRTSSVVEEEIFSYGRAVRPFCYQRTTLKIENTIL